MTDTINNTTTIPMRPITQATLKSLSWKDLHGKHGRPLTKDGFIKSAEVQKKMGTQHTQNFYGAADDCDVMDAIQYAHAVAAKHPNADHKSRNRFFTSGREVLYFYLCDTSEEKQKFMAESKKAKKHLGGEGCPCEDDGSEVSTDVSGGEPTDFIVANQGRLCEDSTLAFRRQQEQNMAFLLYSCDMEWVYQDKDGQPKHKMTSPAPQRSKELVLGLGEKSGFGNYIDWNGDDLVMIVRDYKTAPKCSKWANFPAKDRLKYVPQCTLTPMLRDHLLKYMELIPADSKALFPLTTGQAPYESPEVFAKAERNAAERIQKATKEAAELSEIGHTYLCGISAMRSSYIQYANKGYGRALDEQTGFMYRLAPAMRHSMREQHESYLTKKQKDKELGWRHPVPWELIVEHRDSLLRGEPIHSTDTIA